MAIHRGRTQASLICRAALIAGVAISLASCQNREQLSASDSLQDTQIAQLTVDLQSVRAELAEAKRDLTKARYEASITATDLAGLYRTVNGNARASNENAAKDMTRRGACGTEWTQAANGTWFQTNKICGVSDLKK